MPEAQPRPAPVVFQRQADLFLPTEHALSPWAGDRLHGGPVLGLLTRAVESAIGEDALVPTRLTFDLFRPVPRSALQVRTELVRKSGRLQLLTASLLADSAEVARVTALALHRSTSERTLDRFAQEPRPDGPDGMASGPLLRGRPEPWPMPTGFHTTVETRWLPQQADRPLGIWFRLPIGLVEGETASSLQLAAAMSDFCNAVASISARHAELDSPPYINTDTTLYLARRPLGEWFCLQEERIQERSGISLTQTALCDHRGCFGRSLQARLANDATR